MVMTIFRKSKIGVKACRQEPDGLVSAFCDGKVVGYEIGKWTKRPEKCGPLAIFDTLKSAVYFMDSIYTDKIYFQCKYKKSKETVLYNDRGYHTRTKLPQGTILADKVKLIRRIGNGNPKK